MSAKDKRGKFMNVLEELSGCGSDSESEPSTSEQEGSAKKQKKLDSLTVEDLEKAGYKSGPSVLFMKPPQEETQTNWNWSNGREAKGQEEEETAEERRATRAAVSESLEQTAEYVAKAAAHAEALREAACEEKQRLAAERRLSFNQKEKRKRDTGQTSRSKNYVEEEKRLGRQLGMYSGFD